VQYHELRVTFEFDTSIPGVDSTTSDALEATLWCDYVYLDQEERKKFASQPHEYLIEQIQFTGDENVTIGAATKAQQIRLSFNHPTKLLAWVVSDPTEHGKFTAGYAGATQEALAPLQNAKLMLNGHDRADVRVGAVYNKVIPYQANKANPDAGLYFMSFALSPTQHAPSGSLNLSRIDSAVLALTFKAASQTANSDVANISMITAPETTTTTDATNLTALRVFAVNYNVLRCMSGINTYPVPNSELPIWICAHSILGKQCKCQWISSRKSIYNSLVNYKKLATLSIAGNSLELFLRSLLRNQKCQSRVMTSPTVKTKEIGQSAGTCLRALKTSIRQPLRDYQAMGPRKLVISDEGLRYSPTPCESMGVKTRPGRSCLFQLKMYTHTLFLYNVFKNTRNIFRDVFFVIIVLYIHDDHVLGLVHS
jgi:hypothetical protein